MDQIYFAEFFKLLKETEPISGAYDLEWWGPYFIPRSGSWLPTHFLLHGENLYGTIEIGWSHSTITWNIKTGVISFDRNSRH